MGQEDWDWEWVRILDWKRPSMCLKEEEEQKGGEGEEEEKNKKIQKGIEILENVKIEEIGREEELDWAMGIGIKK